MLDVLVGSEIYQETLAKALAKHFGARLLVVDSLLLPGVSFFVPPLTEFPFLLISSSIH